MTRYYTVAAIGKDQIGIVAEVTRALFDVGSLILDSTNSILGGQFAMMLLVSTTDRVFRASIVSALRPVAAQFDLTAEVKEIAAEDVSAKAAPGRIYSLSVYGNKRPDMVYRVAQGIRDRGWNILGLSSGIKWAGQQEHGVMDIRVQVQDERRDVQSVMDSLLALERELGIHVQVLNEALVATTGS